MPQVYVIGLDLTTPGSRKDSVFMGPISGAILMVFSGPECLRSLVA